MYYGLVTCVQEAMSCLLRIRPRDDKMWGVTRALHVYTTVILQCRIMLPYVYAFVNY